MHVLVSFTPKTNITARYFREPYAPYRCFRTHIGRLNEALHPGQTLAAVLREFGREPPVECRLPKPHQVA